MNLFVLAAAVSVGKVIAAVLIALILGLVIGAQATSHEERALDYNLEDVELDELHKLEADASAEGKAAIAKLKAGAAKARSLEQEIVDSLRRHA